ncbi:MAG TPA: hypothetical protein VFF43_02345, partial [Caldimonas sp.]|nr:hypothetical protein [Caldimonas sp.]
PRQPKPPSKPPLVAVMPGSRDEELAQHLPTLAAAASRMRADGARFRVVASSAERAREIGTRWPAQCGGASAVVQIPIVDATADADVAWVASGTAVLETALRGVPQVAFYRIGDAQYRIVERRLPRIAHGPITLPNLVCGRQIVPELLQHDFEPATLVAKTSELLDDGDARRAQLAGLEDFRRMLGPADALAQIGEYVLGILERTASRAS